MQEAEAVGSSAGVARARGQELRCGDEIGRRLLLRHFKGFACFALLYLVSPESRNKGLFSEIREAWVRVSVFRESRKHWPFSEISMA